MPNVSVRLGKHEHVGGREMRGENAVIEHAEELGVGEFALELVFLRPGADDDLGAGQIERQERFEILLDRDPADGHENRPRQVESDGAVGAEQIDVDAARPHAEIAEPALVELGLQRRRRHHGDRRGGMEPAQDRIDPRCRDRRARRNVFGKARRVARGERPAVAPAIGPHRKADRPFGRDMDGVRLCRFDALGDAAPARDGEPQPGIGRHRERREPVRRQELDGDAELGGGALRAN